MFNCLYTLFKPKETLVKETKEEVRVKDINQPSDYFVYIPRIKRIVPKMDR